MQIWIFIRLVGDEWWDLYSIEVTHAAGIARVRELQREFPRASIAARFRQ